MKTKEEILEIINTRSVLNKEQVLNAMEEYAIQCEKDMFKDQTAVTRFEVIDKNGRAYTEHYCKVELSYQDGGRTLKVFIKPLDKQD